MAISSRKRSVASISPVSPSRSALFDCDQDHSYELVSDVQQHDHELMAEAQAQAQNRGKRKQGDATMAEHRSDDTSMSSKHISPGIEHDRDPRSQESSHIQKGSIKTIVGNFWLWEISACCFSLVCMGVVIGILAYEDGKPIDQWGFRITPNAVVSFIVTVAKSAFILAITEAISQLKWLHFHNKSHRLSDLKTFDEASRGPLGSLKLLITQYRKAILACCAAAIIIAALFVDPFVQLVFSFPSRRTPSPTREASIQTTQLYDPNGNVLDAGSTQTTAQSLGTEMQGAILEGLYNNPRQPSFSCPSGNCTWTDLTTLGVCAGCADITDEIQTQCRSRTVANHSQYGCDYSLPLNGSLEGFLNVIPASELITQTRWNSTTNVSLVDGSFATKLALISTLEAVQLPQAAKEADGIPPPKAYRCGFSFCAKRYKEVTVTNGVINMPIPEEDILRNDYVTDRDGNIGPDYHPGGESFMSMVPNSTLTVRNDTLRYKVNFADIGNIKAYLEEMFTSGWMSIGQSTRPKFKGPLGYHDAIAPDVGRIMAHAQDLNQSMRSIAESMTQYIRTCPNSTAQIGQAYIEKTFIDIRWAWMAYPIVLMFSTLILLGAVMIETHKHHVIAWKSSSLAMLFHRLEGWETSEPRATNNQHLDRIAGRTRGRLFDGGDHPAFIKTD